MPKGTLPETGAEDIRPNSHGILPCSCGTYPRPMGDRASHDDGYRSMWCQGCMKHVVGWCRTEALAIDTWNEERELETGATARYSAEQLAALSEQDGK